MQPTKEQIAEFEKELIALYTKHGLAISPQPQWKQSLDSGAWTLVLVQMIVTYNPPPQAA